MFLSPFAKQAHRRSKVACVYQISWLNFCYCDHYFIRYYYCWWNYCYCNAVICMKNIYTVYWTMLFIIYWTMFWESKNGSVRNKTNVKICHTPLFELIFVFLNMCVSYLRKLCISVAGVLFWIIFIYLYSLKVWSS